MWSDETVAQLKQLVKDKLDLSVSLTDEQLMEMIEHEVFAFPFQSYLTAGQRHQLTMRLFHSFRGLDMIQPLVDDPSVTEIMINRYDRIFIEKEGRVSLTEVKFESKEKLEDVIQAIVSRVNRAVNEANPIVDARLLDGSRVNVVLSPISLDGAAMTIRKFPETPLTLNDLVARGALTEEAASLLIKLVRGKYNLFIGGGTGSGKTTFLNALSQYIPDDERLITIEDSAELQIRTVPNLIRMETRNANTEGKGDRKSVV